MELIEYVQPAIETIKEEDQPTETIIATVFKYNSEVSQTDDDPFTTASGERVHKGSIGCPTRYSFGTVVEIEQHEYVCNDRMAQRYRDGNYFDIWAETKEEAINFGKRKLEVKVYAAKGIQK